jgi:hypothetical protein
MDDRVSPDATVFTDYHGGYAGMRNRHTVRHSVGEYVSDQAHINSLEPFGATMKRGYLVPVQKPRYRWGYRSGRRSCDTREVFVSTVGAVISAR